jgi:peptide/nickel transport system substrate-binding protein
MHSLFARSALAVLIGLSSNVSAESTVQNTLRITSPFEMTSLEPSQQGYILTRLQVLESLVGVDAKGQLIPELATDWDVTGEGQVWTLRLRKKVVFHDGTEMNAQAVKASLEYSISKPSPIAQAGVIDISTPDDFTVVITLDKPARSFGAVLAHYSSAIVSTESIRSGIERSIVGTGPYRLEEFEPPHSVTVHRFDEYWGEKAHIEYAKYLTSHRAESRTLQARSGQADIVFNLDPASLPMLSRLPNVAIHSVDLPRTLAVKVNSGHHVLSDINVRKALSLAIDRKGIANAILRTPGAETDQLLPASYPLWYLDEPLETNNLAEAKVLLEESGWQVNSDGWLEKEGATLALTLITYADRPELTTVATALQIQWKQLGIKINVSITNSSAIPAGHEDGSLELALMARNYGFVADPVEVLRMDFGGVRGGDWGAMDWRSPAQKWLSQLSVTTNDNEYNTLAKTMMQAVYDERPLIPIAYYTQKVAVSQRISGFKLDPYERTYYLNELKWTAK